MPNTSAMNKINTRRLIREIENTIYAYLVDDHTAQELKSKTIYSLKPEFSTLSHNEIVEHIKMYSSSLLGSYHKLGAIGEEYRAETHNLTVTLFFKDKVTQQPLYTSVTFEPGLILKNESSS